MILMQCPHCPKSFKVKEELAGQKIKCPKCAEVLRVPREVDAPVLGGAAAPEGAGNDGSLLPDVPKMEKIQPRSPTDKPQFGVIHDAETAIVRAASTDGSGSLAAAKKFTEFLAPPQQPDEIGRLGPYRVLKVLGAGGMGVVYKAEDPQLERLVALKAMLPSVAANPSAKQRFMREAKLAAGVKHPHVVTIHQVGEERGAPFLAMEFLEGQSLDERLKSAEKMSIGEVLSIGQQIARGLAAAHEKGLIHRDIKPANIWLEMRGEGQTKKPGEKIKPSAEPASPPGKSVNTQVPAPRTSSLAAHVKILDFGLARTECDQTNLTQSGMVVGTPAFMAPEQASGLEVDQRCDLFSLGCVLYHMCTGAAPFKGNTVIAILKATALDEAQPPMLLNTNVPAGLSDLILQLLAKNPDDRPGTAHQVVLTLRAIAAQHASKMTASQKDKPKSQVVVTLRAMAAQAIPTMIQPVKDMPSKQPGTTRQRPAADDMVDEAFPREDEIEPQEQQKKHAEDAAKELQLEQLRSEIKAATTLCRECREAWQEAGSPEIDEDALQKAKEKDAFLAESREPKKDQSDTGDTSPNFYLKLAYFTRKTARHFGVPWYVAALIAGAVFFTIAIFPAFLIFNTIVAVFLLGGAGCLTGFAVTWCLFFLPTNSVPRQKKSDLGKSLEEADRAYEEAHQEYERLASLHKLYVEYKRASQEKQRLEKKYKEIDEK
jgi:serine/threonine protein kinase